MRDFLKTLIEMENERHTRPIASAVFDSAQVRIARKPFLKRERLAAIRPTFEREPIVEHQHGTVLYVRCYEFEYRHRRLVQVAIDPHHSRLPYR